MANEIATIEEKKLKALVETAIMKQPELKDKLTVAAAWQMMQLPDKSFGWTTAGVMPVEMKQLAIIAHFKAGAEPGYGHIYFLGNKLYQSADFIRAKASSNHDWKIEETKFIPHLPEEKAMYGISEKDMSCKCIMKVEYKGKTMEIQGDGIIGADEVASGKPGLNNAKNRAMTLKTRAMRDLYSRFYPTNGVPVAPDLTEEAEVIVEKYPEQVAINNALSTPEIRQERREVIQTEIVDASEKELLNECFDTLNRLKKEAKEKGIKLKELWDACGVSTQKEFQSQALEEVQDGLEVMSDYIENYKEDKSTVSHLDLALNRYREQLKLVTDAGGNPMEILGFNHLNVLEMSEIKEIQKHSQSLVNWLQAPKEAPKDEDDFMSGLDDLDSVPAKKPSCPNALDAIDRLLNHDKVKATPEVLNRIVALSKKTLIEGDAKKLINGSKIALAHGEYDELDNLIKNR